MTSDPSTHEDNSATYPSVSKAVGLDKYESTENASSNACKTNTRASKEAIITKKQFKASHDAYSTKLDRLEDDEGYSSSSSFSSQSSYSSNDSASKSSNTDNIERAIHFLTHPSILDLPSHEKIKYLKLKGLTNREIKSAQSRLENVHDDYDKGVEFDQIYNARGKKKRKTRKRRQRKNSQEHVNEYSGLQQSSFSNDTKTPIQTYRPNSTSNQMNHPEEEFEDNPILPAITLGGMIAVTGLAAIRWLNGGDFVLFPPPQSKSPPNSANAINSMPVSHEIDVKEVTSTIDNEHESENLMVQDVTETNSNNESVDLQKPQHQYSYQYDESDLCDNRESSSEEYADQKPSSRQPTEALQETQILANEIKALSTSIQELRLFQEKKKSERASKDLTNSAMTLLQQNQETSPTSDSNMYEKQNKNAQVNLSLVMAFAEIKSDINTIKQHLLAQKDEGQRSFQKDILDKLEKIIESMKQIEQQRMTTETEENSQGTMNPNIKNEDGFTQKKSNWNTTEPVVKNEETPTKNYLSISPLEVHENDSQIDSDSKGQVSLTLEQALHKIQAYNDSATLQSGAPMLRLYTLNLSKNPMVPRYRKIYTTNASFQNKVQKLVGAMDLLQSVGFIENDNILEWKPELLSQAEDTDQIESTPTALNASKIEYATSMMKAAASGIQKILSDLSSNRMDNESTQNQIMSSPSISTLNSNNLSNTSFQTPDTKVDLLTSPPLMKKTEGLEDIVSDIPRPLNFDEDDIVSPEPILEYQEVNDHVE